MCSFFQGLLQLAWQKIQGAVKNNASSKEIEAM
jgi:hypothetical protein